MLINKFIYRMWQGFNQVYYRYSVIVRLDSLADAGAYGCSSSAYTYVTHTLSGSLDLFGKI